MRMLARYLRVSFTLTDLLILIGIIAIVLGLVGTLLPAFTATRENYSPNVPYCMGNLKQIGLALSMYSQMNGECYPYYNSPNATDSLALLYPDLIPTSHAFRCLRKDEPEITVTLDAGGKPTRQSFGKGPAHSSYGYDRTIGPRSDPNMPVAGDMDGTSVTNPKTVTANHRGGQNILFFDGHVKWMQVNTWVNGDGLTDNFYAADLAPTYEPDPPVGPTSPHLGDTDAFIQRP